MRPAVRRAAVPGAAALLVLGAAAGLWALSRTARVQVLGDMVDRVETDERVVALTFDDGPNPPWTGRILDVLASRRARASFFFVGEAVHRHPELVRRALAEGHEVGNHSWSHPRLVLVTPSFCADQLDRTDAALRAAGATGDLLFRAPYAKKLFVLPAVLKARGRTNVLFDVFPKDYLRPPPQTIVYEVLANIRPGSVVVMHDGGGVRDETVAALGPLLDALARDGWRTLGAGELLRLRR